MPYELYKIKIAFYNSRNRKRILKVILYWFILENTVHVFLKVSAVDQIVTTHEPIILV